MLRRITLHEGVIRKSLVTELESFRAPGRLVSSYYLNMDPQYYGNPEAIRVAVRDTLEEHREQVRKLDVPAEQRHGLERDWELIREAALSAVGQRGTRSVACFAASESDYGRALPLPWPVRQRVFFEDRFVVWPLRQILDQADLYGIVLTDKDEDRLYLFFMERVEEVADLMDMVPGRVRFPDPFGESHYMRKQVEHFHEHFDRVAAAALRLYERDRYEHLIIGGLRETLPQFESRLHRYARDRIVARWDVDVLHTPSPQIAERAAQEEQKVLNRQAQDIWQTMQDYRPYRGALGPEETFAALWQRRVQALLVEPKVAKPGFRCSVCGRLQLSGGACVECGGKTGQVRDVFDEAVHDAVEQSAQVRYWPDPALKEVGSVAALKRF